MRIGTRLRSLVVSVLVTRCSSLADKPRRDLHCSVVEPPRKNNSTIISYRGGGGRNETNFVRSNRKYHFPLLRNEDGSEDDIPSRYLKMQKGNVKKATAAVKATLAWREEHDVDTILERPYPNLEVFKALVPHGFLGRDPKGHVIFCLRCGYLDFALMKEHSISHEAMVMHYVYVLEYLWNILEPHPNATMLFVLDLSGVSLNKIRRSVGFINQFVSTIDQHYPQRAHKTMLVNVPRWFGVIYKAISPFLRESTRQLIEMHSCGKAQTKALQKSLGKGVIPDEMLKSEPQSKPLMSSIQQEFEEFSRSRTIEAGEKLVNVQLV